MMAGKPMVQWVYEAASRCAELSAVVVATPDDEIVNSVKGFGGEAVLTSAAHPTGTDRIAEVSRLLDSDAYLNIQGDEPLIQTSTISACAKLMSSDVQLASVYDLAGEGDADNPMVVKVVTDEDDFALYFSRSPIPFIRGEAVPLKKHIGLYGFTKDALAKFAGWEPTPLEKAESLEQLRFMEHGLRIKMTRAEATPLAVDTPEQAEEAARLLAAGVGR